MTGCRAGEELEREKLAADLREMENSVTHLERSNKELEEALEVDPEDQDFKTAIQENKEVISRRIKEIEELKKKIKELEDRHKPPPPMVQPSMMARPPGGQGQQQAQAAVMGGVPPPPGAGEGEVQENGIYL